MLYQKWLYGNKVTATWMKRNKLEESIIVIQSVNQNIRNDEHTYKNLLLLFKLKQVEIFL